MVLHKEHTSNYTVIDNNLLNDSRLSFKAKGILCYLLSKPEGWEVRVNHLATQSSTRKTAIASGIKELRRNGYAIVDDIRDTSGRFVNHRITVYETPQLGNPE